MNDFENLEDGLMADGKEITTSGIKLGSVTGCEKLRVRKQPNKEADVVSVLELGTQVKINIAKSNDKWLNVNLKDGIIGFCMKDFILVKDEGE